MGLKQAESRAEGPRIGGTRQGDWPALVIHVERVNSDVLPGGVVRHIEPSAPQRNMHCVL